jgi:hypothetical protein
MQHVRIATAYRAGIVTAARTGMPMDFLSLLQRDHGDLQQELTQLLDPLATVPQLRAALDGVWLGLTAHSEAEDIVLGRFEGIATLEVLVRQGRGAHQLQERTLSALVTARPGTTSWRELARHLRDLVHEHAVHEEQYLLPALRELAPQEMYAALAGAFATERLRQLAMLQPSAPLYLPEPPFIGAHVS